MKLFGIKRNKNNFRTLILFGVKIKLDRTARKVCPLFEKLSNEIAGVKSDVTKVESEIVNVKKEVASVKNDVGSVKKELSNVKNEVTGVKIEVGTVKNEVAGVKKDVVNVRNEVCNVRSDAGGIKGELTDVKNEVGTVKNEVAGVKILSAECHDALNITKKLYRNKFEQNFMCAFKEYMGQKDFEEKYLSLIANLSGEDVFKINTILKRLQTILASPLDAKQNLFNLEEQKELCNLYDNFFAKILKISDNLFVYGNYRLPINQFEPCVFYYRHGMDFVINKQKIKNTNIIDAGGFIGDSAVVLSEYTEKIIYSFEAIPANCELFEKTIALNNITNVKLIQKALFNVNTLLRINNRGSCSSLYANQAVLEKERIAVSAIRLDDFVFERNIEVGLIKVDLEGAERAFLKGAVETIKKYKPVLLVSIYHNPQDFFEIKPWLESLNLGYSFRVFYPVDRGICLETMIIAEVEE